MLWNKFLSFVKSRGIGSPGETARAQALTYNRIVEANQSLAERDVLRLLVQARLRAARAVGDTSGLLLLEDPDCLEEFIKNHVDLLTVTLYFVFIDHPELSSLNFKLDDALRSIGSSIGKEQEQVVEIVTAELDKYAPSWRIRTQKQERLRDGRRESAGNSSVQSMYREIHAYLLDEARQNLSYSEEFHRIAASRNSAQPKNKIGGSFGQCTTNPIEVNGPIGELIYLSSLVFHTNGRIMFHRLGSIDGIDLFEVVTCDGSSWDLLCIDMYHLTKARKAPNGYRIMPLDPEWLWGTTEYLEDFPHGLMRAIPKISRAIAMAPLRPPKVERYLTDVHYERPPDHLHKLQIAFASLTSRASNSTSH